MSARARMHGAAAGDAHTDAHCHEQKRASERAHIHAGSGALSAQTAITAGVQRSLELVPPRTQLFTAAPTTDSLAPARVLHETFYLSLASRVSFRVGRSLLLPPFAFLFLHDTGYNSPRCLCTPPSLPLSLSWFLSTIGGSLLFFRFTVSPFSLFSFWPPSLPDDHFSPPRSVRSHTRSHAVHASRWCALATLVPSLLLSPSSFTRARRCSRTGTRECNVSREERTGDPLFSRPQRGMGYRGPIMDLSVGCSLARCYYNNIINSSK